MLKPGELTGIIQRLRRVAPQHDLASVIVYAFDRRTRMLPFIYADWAMVPAGVRAIGSAMVASGFEKTRVVQQLWNPRFAPSAMRLDGRVPDLFMVSSLQLHSACCRALIQDACRIDPAHRPLIIAGGPKTVYEPWDVFSADPSDPWGADVAVTGEEFVLLSLLEVVLSCRALGESLRSAFLRACRSGLLDDIPGLVYPRTDARGAPKELIDTGIQRLLGDLDELPHPVLGYRLLEAPSRFRAGLSDRAMGRRWVRLRTPIASLVLTFGCKFACPYCPLPAYNQRQFRVKSPERIVDEFCRLRSEYGIKWFFGTDDNFFNDHRRAHGIVEALARAEVNGKPLYKQVEWGTEVTVHDTVALKAELPTVRRAGVRMLWLGVEDITASFVKKGQSLSKTQEAFEALRAAGIAPMPMMMHHDGQPLYTPGSPYGLINQVRMLRRWGAAGMQVLMMTPATGSKLYEEPFNNGQVIESVSGRRVEPYMMDGNYVVATQADEPWRKQCNILAAYLYFFNPLALLRALLPRDRVFTCDIGMQLMGMGGLFHTIRRTVGWAWRLRRGDIKRRTSLPSSPLPFHGLAAEPASHDLPAPKSSPPAFVSMSLRGEPVPAGAQVHQRGPEMLMTLPRGR